MGTFLVLFALITPSGVTFEKLESPEYPTYQHCVNAGIADASYRSNPTTKVKFACVVKNQK
jgi:hypothetical protein